MASWSSWLVLVACGVPTFAPEREVDGVPIADAGANATVPAGQPVVVDGRASYDPEGSALSYHWTLDSAPVGSALLGQISPLDPNHDASGATTFVPDTIGVFVVRLEVDDGTQRSTPSFVILDATEAATTPVAEAGPDRSITLGEAASLDGTQSWDPLGGGLTYTWALVVVPSASDLLSIDLEGATTPTATLTPDVPGTYTATLVVDNGIALSPPDAVTVTVGGANQPPIAVVSPSVSAEDCTWVGLDCTDAYDPEGGTLTWYWEVQEVPEGSGVTSAAISDRSSAEPEVYPDVAGTYLLSCSVFDGFDWSDPALVQVTAVERATNTPPMADAGTGRTMDMGEATCKAPSDCASCAPLTAEIGRDGSATDIDGDALTIEWVVTEGSAELADPGALPATLTVDGVTPLRAGQCTSDQVALELTVTDCVGESSVDTLVLAAECCGVGA